MHVHTLRVFFLENRKENNVSDAYHGQAVHTGSKNNAVRVRFWNNIIFIQQNLKMTEFQMLFLRFR